MKILKRRFGPSARPSYWLNHIAHRPTQRPWLAFVIAFLALSIFVIDLFTQTYPKGVFYSVLLLISAGTGLRAWVLWTAILSVALTLITYVIAPYFMSHTIARILSICFVTFGLLCFLWATELLRERARLLDQTHDCISTYDMDGAITFWNKSAAQLYGWTGEEAYGAFTHELLKTRLPLPAHELRALLLKKGFWEGRVINRAKDGRKLTLDSRWSLLRDEFSRPRGILETSNDVSHREDSDRANHRSEIRYRTIFETAVVSILECDISKVRHRTMALRKDTPIEQYLRDHPEFVREAIGLMHVVDVNDASVRMFGVRGKDDLVGNIDRFWPVESERVFARAMIAVSQNRSMFEAEATMQTEDGRRFELIFTMARSSEAEYRNTVFLSLIDITPLNRARAALQLAQSDLARATRLTSLGQLTASLAHEVNQPLAVIVANGQAGLRWLDREAPNIPAAITSLERLVGDAKRAGSIIVGVQALGRNDASEQVLLNLNEVVTESLMLLTSELNRFGVKLTIELDDAPAYIQADRIQIQQVIINLVTNAIQAMSETYERPRILLISTMIEDSTSVVTVNDTGPGIGSMVRDRLFTAFTTTKADGMGLGLSICESIVSRHGGLITASDNDRGGASFSFTLPLVVAL
jgi:PAS domain S-box-containing protein